MIVKWNMGLNVRYFLLLDAIYLGNEDKAYDLAIRLVREARRLNNA